MDNAAPILMWFRRDLRLADNPALTAAAAGGRPVIPLYIRDEALEGRPIGAAARWWLDRSLAALGEALAAVGSRLVLRQGDTAEVLAGLIGEIGAGALAWNRLHDPGVAERDRALAAALKARGVELIVRDAQGLLAPRDVRTGAGGAYKVFGAFQKAVRPRLTEAPLHSAPKTLRSPSAWPRSEPLAAFSPHWSGGFSIWTPGEPGALERLTDFIDTDLADYPRRREFPGVEGSSRLSPHLHFGEVSPARVAARAERAAQDGDAPDSAAEKLIGEVLWREFNLHLLAERPDLARANLRTEFDAFPWRKDPECFRAWTRGLTGYPIVDAGMRQLWATGWMHNRVRMITASFLVKHLLIDWRAGEAWFWDTLVDADQANNAGNWQWVAGSGADAAPYFRIFNPILQGERFDPGGAYVRRWVPELAALPDKAIHAPFRASATVLDEAGVVLGETYPQPIVDHALARRRALEAYASIR